MAAGTILTVVGGAVQLLGLVVAGLGVRNVRITRSTGLGVWGTIKAFSLHRLFRRRPPGTLNATANIAQAHATAPDARVEVGPPDDPALYQEFIFASLTFLREAVDDLRARATAESRHREAEIVRLEDLVAEMSAASRAETNMAMTESLVQQTVGLACAALGTVLTIIGAGFS